jgi:acyl-CoA reductase-like NAD-dependent aldehyde dehydrogenase
MVMAKMLDVMNPATNELIESLPLNTGEELEKMVEIAVIAQKAWERVPIVERAKPLYAFCDSLEAHQQEIGELMAREMCKPINTGKSECSDTAEIGRGHIERAKHLYGDVLTGTSAGKEYDLGFTKREALGVVVGVIPFNYPVEVMLQKAIPSLIMGNAIIVKAPSPNPLAVKKLVELAHKAGVPKDILQFTVCSRTDCTSHLLTHPKVAAIGMTGSTAAGTEMLRAGSDTIKKVFLELGGNDPLIVCEDVDIDKAVQSMANGRVCNNGQLCCATKRFIVHESIKDELIEKLKKTLDTYKFGSPLEPGVLNTGLISEDAAIRVESQIKKTVEQGGTIVYGGNRYGNQVEYTIIDNVPATADAARDMEIFGPVWPIISFKTEEEAIEIANQTKYGLSSGVMCSDIVRAFNIANRIDASAVIVNGDSAYRQNEQPFGGCKASGLGNEGVISSLEEYSRLKTYVLKGAFVK